MNTSTQEVEAKRLAALREYAILDTPPDEDFDALVTLAARVCDTPMALISLVDQSRQWFKAKVGLALSETPRENSICAYAIEQGGPLIIPDARLDSRFAANPLVTGPPYLRFYAGVPLRVKTGEQLGTLCVIDSVPRVLAKEQIRALQTLCREVVTQLELRRARADLRDVVSAAQAAEEALRASEQFKTRLIEGSQDCIKLLDCDGRLLSVNSGGLAALEICDLGALIGSPWIDFWQDPYRQMARDAVASARRGAVGRFVGFFATVRTGTPKWWDVVVSPILDRQGKTERLLAVSRDVTESKRAEELLRAIIQGTAGVTGTGFFRSLVRHLAEGLHVRFAFVAECLPKGRARSLAYFQDNAYGPDFEYELAGTPCMEVAQGRVCHIPDRLAEVFPEDKGMIDLGTVSYLGVPLLNAEKRVIGHLVIFDDKPLAADSLALSVMETFAARAGAELEREQATEGLRRAHERRRTLLEITNAIIKHLTQDDLLEATCDALKHVLAFDRAAFTLYNPDTDGLRILAIEGHFQSHYYQVGREIPRRESHPGWAFDHQLPLVRRDLEAEGTFASERALAKEGVRSLCTVPLIVGGRSIGTMNLASTTRSQYTDEDAALLQEVGNQVAIAVSNMRAFEDLQRLAAENEAILNVNRAIGHHLNRHELFAALAGSLQKVVPTERFGIELPIEAGKLQGYILTPATSPQAPQIAVLPADGTACAWVLKSREWFVAPTRDELRERFPVTFRVMEDERMQSLCVLPLVTGTHTRGALFFMASTNGAYRNISRTLLEQVASAVAVALDDCLAHEEVRRLRDRLAAENAYLQEEIRAEHNFTEIVGNSPKLRAVLQQVEQIAPTDSTVLILGETGTGKELVARAIHDRSGRKNRPLVKVNCGAISAGLVESELFGHVKGAFTGALGNRDGRFKLADGGTIFLDEVGELPLETQVKLLRVLQEHEFEPVGSSQTIRVNVRIIAATNRNLAAASEEGRFRRDLFYRLNVLPIHLPPLRERSADLPLLVQFFLQMFAKRFGRPLQQVPDEVMQRMLLYAWPGNIRELQNVIERAVVLSKGSYLTINEELPPAPIPHPAAVAPEPISARPSTSTVAVTAAASPARTLEDVERRHIESVLAQTRWMIEGESGAARLLNLHPSTLRSRMQKLGIKRPGRV